jgi:hypothetical protein
MTEERFVRTKEGKVVFQAFADSETRAANITASEERKRTNVADTSIAAYRSMPVKQLATQADRICNLVKNYCGMGGDNLSLKEIKDMYNKAFCLTRPDIELSTISARVNALVAAKRLERLETTRKCSISGVSIHPVRVPS